MHVLFLHIKHTLIRWQLRRGIAFMVHESIGKRCPMREHALEYIFKSWNNSSSKMLYSLLFLSIFKHLNIFNPTFLCWCFSRCLYKAEWCSRSLFSEVDWQKLQADGVALALHDIYVSPDFKRYECFGSLEIIGTEISFKLWSF